MADDLNEGTTLDTEAADPNVDNGAGDSGATLTEGGDSFLDDDQSLMDRIRGNPDTEEVFKRMQASFTKKMQRLGKVKNAEEMIERFNSDPEFAKMTIQQKAAQLGMALALPGQVPGQSPQPSSMVDRLKAKLDPSLHWLAPLLAESVQDAVGAAVQPIQQTVQLGQQQSREQQFDQAAQELSGKRPGWEVREEDIIEMLDFMQSPAMQHQRFGSKLERLDDLVRGKVNATTELAQRTAQAARNRTTTGQTGKPPAPDLRDRVLKPKQFSEAFREAEKIAIEELRQKGIAVPD